MPYDWEEHDDEVAAGAICPEPDCGALAFAYRSTDLVGRDDAEPWEFTCPLRNGVYCTGRRAKFAVGAEGLALGESSRRITGVTRNCRDYL